MPWWDDSSEPWEQASPRLVAQDLVTMKEIASLLGLTYQYVRALKAGSEHTRIPFPDPETYLSNRPLWKKSTILEWWGARGKRD